MENFNDVDYGDCVKVVNDFTGIKTEGYEPDFTGYCVRLIQLLNKHGFVWQVVGFTPDKGEAIVELPGVFRSPVLTLRSEVVAENLGQYSGMVNDQEGCLDRIAAISKSYISECMRFTPEELISGVADSIAADHMGDLCCIVKNVRYKALNDRIAFHSSIVGGQ